MENLIDHYLSNLSIENRVSLIELREFLHELLPTSEECISYGMPTLRVNGRSVAGFAAYKNHLSFFPFSGSIIGEFTSELVGYTYTKSGIHFTPEKPIPKILLKRIIEKRITQI